MRNSCTGLLMFAVARSMVLRVSWLAASSAALNSSTALANSPGSISRAIPPGLIHLTDEMAPQVQPSVRGYAATEGGGVAGER